MEGKKTNKYLKYKNFKFRWGVYSIILLIFVGVSTFKISSSIMTFRKSFKDSKASEEFL